MTQLHKATSGGNLARTASHSFFLQVGRVPKTTEAAELDWLPRKISVRSGLKTVQQLHLCTVALMELGPRTSESANPKALGNESRYLPNPT